MTEEVRKFVIDAVEGTKKELTAGRSLMYPSFSKNSSMYTFTTENLAGYINKLNVAGKDCLTVTASGDQLLSLAFHGARNVDCFDLNENTYFFTQLKIGAMKSLSYEEFVNFFVDCERRELYYYGIVPRQRKVEPNIHAYEFETYQKIRKSLTPDVQMYWDSIYKHFEYDHLKMADSFLFMGCDREKAIMSNDYLQNEETYLETRRKIDYVGVRFFSKDIMSIHEIPCKYDVVLLSNIYDYLVHEYIGTMTSEDFLDYLEHGIQNILNDGAKVAAAYKYNYKSKKEERGETYFGRSKVKKFKNAIKKLFESKWKLDKIDSFEKFGMKKIVFPAVIAEYEKRGDMDCCYVYETGKVR